MCDSKSPLPALRSQARIGATIGGVRQWAARWASRLAASGYVDPLVRMVFARASWLLPVRRVVETRRVIVFRHPRPHWATHLLLVPKVPIASYRQVGPEHGALLAKVLSLAAVAAAPLDPPLISYALIVNGGAS